MPKRPAQLCAAATCVIVLAAPGVARAEVPTLMGEIFSGVSPNLKSFTANCDPQGTSTITYDATGPAAGPYPGTFTEHGTVQIAPQNDDRGPFTFAPQIHYGLLTKFDVSFTIDSAVGQVSGTKTLIVPQSSQGVCATEDGIEAFELSDATVSARAALATMEYTATINPPTGGKFQDTGRASAQVSDSSIFGTTPLGNTGGGGLGSGASEFFDQSNGVVPLCTNDPTDINPDDALQPGNGFGDDNHCHTGPPGQIPTP